MQKTICALLTIVTISFHSSGAEPERLNIISIVTDDQARWSLGVYGNHDSITPNMDRICREGATFLNAFTATPVCSPSRATFMSGRYGTQVGITDWISPDEAKAGVGLAVNAMIWPQVLQQNGYKTALIGKWHLGEQPQFHPTQRGFDLFYGFLAGGTTPMDPTFEVNGQDTKLKGPEPDIVVDEALRFVTTNRTRPFALLLHFRAPHLPYGPVPEEDSAPFKNIDPPLPETKGVDAEQVKGWTRDYYASIHSVDRNLGRLLAKLDELDLTRKTIVLFTSDHGYNIGHHILHTKGNGYWIAGGLHGPTRPNMWDTSMRVPLGIRWPGVVKPGTEIKEVVSNLDTFASVLGMLGVSAPTKYKQEGLDFSPLLHGEKIPPRNELYGQYNLHNNGLAFMRMIRTDEWKLIRFYVASGLDELYNLKNDPGETRNLYKAPVHRAVREDLQKRLTSWQQNIKDNVAHMRIEEAVRSYAVQPNGDLED
jgi:choline-sulfatase